MTRTETGLEVLAQDPSRLAGKRVGMLTNFTSVTLRLERGVDALLGAGVDIVALFGPEHGLHGTAQAGVPEPSSLDQRTGIPIIETYRLEESLDDVIRAQDLDVLVCDLQDIGVRYWTYVWTVYDALCSAARIGLPVLVLDRPNPLGGVVADGPELDRRFASFVGRTGVRQRHGLTIGELALLFNASDMPREAGRPAELDVVPMRGWNRAKAWEQTGSPWVMPSPNLPTIESVFAFAATGLLEGTNASEGRGTTRPFELFGAPYVDARLVPRLEGFGLPGVAFRETWFRPTFHKHAGETVRGAQLHIEDPEAFEAVRTGLAVLQAFAELYPDAFEILPPIPDADADHAGYALDRLWGSDSLRLAISECRDLAELSAGSRQADCYPADALLYAR